MRPCGRGRRRGRVFRESRRRLVQRSPGCGAECPVAAATRVALLATPSATLARSRTAAGKSLDASRADGDAVAAGCSAQQTHARSAKSRLRSGMPGRGGDARRTSRYPIGDVARYPALPPGLRCTTYCPDGQAVAAGCSAQQTHARSAKSRLRSGMPGRGGDARRTSRYPIGDVSSGSRTAAGKSLDAVPCGRASRRGRVFRTADAGSFSEVPDAERNVRSRRRREWQRDQPASRLALRRTFPYAPARE